MVWNFLRWVPSVTALTDGHVKALATNCQKAVLVYSSHYAKRLEQFFNYFFFFSFLQTLYMNCLALLFNLSFTHLLRKILLESFIATFIISFIQQRLFFLFDKTFLDIDIINSLKRYVLISPIFRLVFPDEITKPTAKETPIQHKKDVQNVEHDIIPVPRRMQLREASVPHLYYEIDSQTEHFLPPHVRIFSHFEDFKAFCGHPNDFTCFRTYCVIKKRDRELAYIFEVIHVCDYIGHAFMNAVDFFEPKHFNLLSILRQVPRSILVVNGKFICSQVLPDHEFNENPEAWVINALQILWKEYCLPGGKKQLNCCRMDHFGNTQLSQERDLDLKQRIGKLLDILAVAYQRLEKLFHGRSVELIRSEVERLAGSSHILNSPSMIHQWSQIRQFELMGNKQHLM